jgi:hypothetical protein
MSNLLNAKAELEDAVAKMNGDAPLYQVFPAVRRALDSVNAELELNPASATPAPTAEAPVEGTDGDEPGADGGVAVSQDETKDVKEKPKARRSVAKKPE